jgi:hypothetical protein
MVDAAVPQRVVALAAGASWLLPLTGLALVGFSEHGAALLPLSNGSLVLVALATAVPGLAIGVAAWLASTEHERDRRRAIAGVVMSVAVLVVGGVGSVSGAMSGERAQRELRQAADAAARDFPGWNGGAMLDGANVYALEVDARSELATLLLKPYDQPFRVVLFGVDNRAGNREVVLDLQGVRAHREGGDVAEAAASVDRLAHADHALDSVVLAQLEPVHVAPGERFDGAQALFAASMSFEDVRSIEIRVDGSVRTLPGRYFTLAEKRAIDQARRN